jgi:hypothetical protein
MNGSDNQLGPLANDHGQDLLDLGPPNLSKIPLSTSNSSVQYGGDQEIQQH